VGNLAEVERMKLREPNLEDKYFVDFRRRIKEAEVLPEEMKLLMGHLKFSGRISVVVQNGRILKAGYEEGYFTRRQEHRLLS
jgi:hypothetical protein